MYLVTTDGYCKDNGIAIEVVGLYDYLDDAEDAIIRVTNDIFSQNEKMRELYDKDVITFKITDIRANTDYRISYVDKQRDVIYPDDELASYYGDSPIIKFLGCYSED